MLLSLITGLLMVLIFRYTSDQNAIRQAKDRLKAHLLAVRLFQDQLPVVLSSYRKIIADFAEAQRLPTLFGFSEFAAAGGLISYGLNLPDLYRRAAVYVDKILKGAKPADLPVEQPTKFELIVNLKTAKALGLRIPPELLVRADQVIQ